MVESPEYKTFIKKELELIRASEHIHLKKKFKDHNTSMIAHREAILDRGVDAVSLDGLWLEFGVFKGTSINYIARKTENTVWGFDSFEGLPKNWDLGGGVVFPKERFKLSCLPTVVDNVELVKGWFNKTLPAWVAKNEGEIALLHVDCDMYESTKTIFDEMFDRIVPGTVILFDELIGNLRNVKRKKAYSNFVEGEMKAWYEFLQEKKCDYEYIAHLGAYRVAVKIC